MVEQFECDAVVGAALQAQRSLANRGQHPRGIKDLGDVSGQTEPLQARFRQDDRIQPLLSELAQACLNIAAQVHQSQVRPAMQRLRPAAEAARADHGPWRQILKARMTA